MRCDDYILQPQPAAIARLRSAERGGVGCRKRTGISAGGSRRSGESATAKAALIFFAGAMKKIYTDISTGRFLQLWPASRRDVLRPHGGSRIRVTGAGLISSGAFQVGNQHLTRARCRSEKRGRATLCPEVA